MAKSRTQTQTFSNIADIFHSFTQKIHNKPLSTSSISHGVALTALLGTIKRPEFAHINVLGIRRGQDILVLLVAGEGSRVGHGVMVMVNGTAIADELVPLLRMMKGDFLEHRLADVLEAILVIGAQLALKLKLVLRDKPGRLPNPSGWRQWLK